MRTKSIGSFGTGVIGGSEPPYMGCGTPNTTSLQKLLATRLLSRKPALVQSVLESEYFPLTHRHHCFALSVIDGYS